MADQGLAPIIVKRKKQVSGGGHHGGAWKVAYADFVTAMMAFFLLMWLLNATTEKQRKGLADYFSPTIPVHAVSAGGNDAFNGESVMSEEVLARIGAGSLSEHATQEDRARGSIGALFSDSDGGEEGPDDMKFTEIESLLQGKSGESEVADPMLQHIITRITDEGLVIEVFDLPDSPLFVVGTAVPTETLTIILAMIAEVTNLVTNSIAVSGHTGLEPESAGGIDNFLLSSDRAQSARHAMLGGGTDPARIARVTGEANRDPVLPDGPDYRNRRVEITLLRSDPRR